MLLLISDICSLRLNSTFDGFTVCKTGPKLASVPELSEDSRRRLMQKGQKDGFGSDTDVSYGNEYIQYKCNVAFEIVKYKCKM